MKLDVLYNFSCQPILSEEEEVSQSFIVGISNQPFYTHNSVKEMIRAQDPSTMISDKRGDPIFPMGLMYTTNGEKIPYVYDSGSSMTSILLGTDGLAFLTAPVDSGEQEWQRVRGVGGHIGVRLVYILVPLTDGTMAKIKAQVIENTLQSQTRNLGRLAEMLAREAKSAGLMEEGEIIQCPEYGSKAALMLGRSHAHLAPKPIFTMSNGLTLYAGCIDGPRAQGSQRTLCVGGSLLEKGCQEKFSNLWMSITQPDVIKNVIVEGSKARAGMWGCQWQDLSLTMDDDAMQIFSEQPDIANMVVHGSNKILGNASQYSRNVADIIAEAEQYSLTGDMPNSLVLKRNRHIQESQNFLLQHGLEER